MKNPIIISLVVALVFFDYGIKIPVVFTRNKLDKFI